MILSSLVLLVGSTALAADGLTPYWSRLAADADVIVVGECAAESSGWDDAGGFITTTIRFRAQRYYKGTLEPALTIKTLGGRVGDQSMAASHGASLAAGEQVLLFLKRSEFGLYYVVVGGEAGKLTVEGPLSPGAEGPTQGSRAELIRLLSRREAQ